MEDLATFLSQGMTLKQAKRAMKEKNKEYVGSEFRKKAQGSKLSLTIG